MKLFEFKYIAYLKKRKFRLLKFRKKNEEGSRETEIFVREGNSITKNTIKMKKYINCLIK